MKPPEKRSTMPQDGSGRYARACIAPEAEMQPTWMDCRTLWSLPFIILATVAIVLLLAGCGQTALPLPPIGPLSWGAKLLIGLALMCYGALAFAYLFVLGMDYWISKQGLVKHKDAQGKTVLSGKGALDRVSQKPDAAQGSKSEVAP